MAKIKVEKLSNYKWRIPKGTVPGMKVDGIFYASERLYKDIQNDNSLLQLANVATLPGIVKYSLAMPDIHWGYGFPIGGVAATNPEDGGIISPGGVGYDVNCGVRLLRTNLTFNDVRDRIRDLVNALFERIPTGVGSTGSIRLSEAEMRNVLKKGARWAIDNGYGRPEDLLYTEENGCLEFADPSAPSRRAYQRGRNQLGTLGSGNHFLEVQLVEKIYDRHAAEVLGLEEGMITVMIHTGSRGFGHQVCDDTIKAWSRVPQKYGISIPDRQLVCAPVNSPEGQRYLAAMACAANYAWANRQCLMHWTRQVFQRFFGMSDSQLGMDLVYDVAHNIAKIEEHEVNGKKITLCVHRKGATRAFPPGHPDVPERYRSIGQPVIIPGDMGTHSYVLVGTELAMEEAFGTTCHGAGRVLSRRQAIRTARGRNIQRELEEQDIYVRSAGRETLAEEMPEAYKDVDEVVSTAHGAGISKRVARMRPLGVIKG